MKKDVETTEQYWDCECSFPRGYIWPKSVEECPRCGARQNEQPDSRVDEIAEPNMACPDE